MPVDARHLLRADPRFQALAARHEACERKLAELRSRRWLSEEERLEEVRLKKTKLALKDAMATILRRAAG